MTAQASTTPRFGHHVRGLDAPTVATAKVQETSTRVLEAALNRTLAFISGPVGTGKSYATARAVENTEKRLGAEFTVVWIELSRSIGELALLCELYEQLAGVRPPSRPVARELRQHIAALLAEDHRLLIVDEAQHISKPALLELRWFFDRADANFGMIFVGTEDLWKKLAKEMRSRTSAHVKFERMPNSGVASFLTDLDPLFATADPKRLRDLNQTHANGELRWWAKFLVYAQRYAAAVGTDQLDDVIDAILEALPPA